MIKMILIAVPTTKIVTVLFKQKEEHRMEKLACDRLSSCRAFNFHILLNSWSLTSLTFWPVAQFRSFNSEWFLDRKKMFSQI